MSMKKYQKKMMKQEKKLKKRISLEIKTILTILITEIRKKEPNEIDYAYTFWLIQLWNDYLLELKQSVIKEVKETHYDNYLLAIDDISENLSSIGINTTDYPIYTPYNKVKSTRITKLVNKQFDKMSTKIKNQILNSLNQTDLNGALNLLQKSLNNEKKANSLTNTLMRIFRTESTSMRSRLKLNVQEQLLDYGIKVKRKWVHTLFNSRNVILDSYTPRADHLEMNGQVEDDNGYFHNSEASTKAPCMFGIPSEDINCRCDVEFILDDPKD